MVHLNADAQVGRLRLNGCHVPAARLRFDGVRRPFNGLGLDLVHLWQMFEWRVSCVACMAACAACMAACAACVRVRCVRAWVYVVNMVYAVVYAVCAGYVGGCGVWEQRTRGFAPRSSVGVRGESHPIPGVVLFMLLVWIV